MLVSRCSSQLSSHKLQAKSKKSQAPSGAQDDDLVGGKSIGSLRRKHEKIEKVTGSQDSDFVGVLKKIIQRALLTPKKKGARICHKERAR